VSLRPPSNEPDVPKLEASIVHKNHFWHDLHTDMGTLNNYNTYEHACQTWLSRVSELLIWINISGAIINSRTNCVFISSRWLVTDDYCNCLYAEKYNKAGNMSISTKQLTKTLMALEIFHSGRVYLKSRIFYPVNFLSYCTLCSLRRRSAAARLLRLWVRIPPGAWMFVCYVCCVLSGRGLCDELIPPTDCGASLCVI
jgi:hypothetical protein